MGKSKIKKKVFVGLSGGVDSSVSAALLLSQGYDVHGVFIKVWQPDWINCTWREDRLDAMRVCAKLDIPFFTLDLEKKYKKEVVDYMIAKYKSGRTPNPDVMCNKHVKFGAFFDWAMKQGADYVATGHYARIVKRKTSNLELLAGKDKNKDQSYFLWTLNQKQLAKTLFPVGNIEKPEVRKLARKFDLPTATKKDSQGLCFIGKVEMAEFLKHFIKTKKGNVLDESGEIIGQHKGTIFYTIGQRHGFTLTKNSPENERSFVVAKDIKKNTITVSSRTRRGLVRNQHILTGLQKRSGVLLENVNWTLGTAPDFNKEYLARIRYRQPIEKCHLLCQGSTLTVKFRNQPMSPASGQSVVIYDGKICLGGGIIV